MLDWPIRRELVKLPAKGTIIVHGAARGADSIAGVIAKEFGFDVRVYPVTPEEWSALGKAAGVLRNTKMLCSEHPDANGVTITKALGFSVDIEHSNGSRNMASQLREANVPTEIFKA